VKRRAIYIVAGFAAISLIAGIWLLYNYIRGVTVEEVDAIVKSHISTGANKAEVSAYIDSLKIDSLKVENFGYQDDLTHMGIGPFTPKDEQLKETMKGYLQARIQDTSRTYFLTSCWMDIRFYFDKDERLIDYKIVEPCDGP
jgi:hypothetical protein